MFPFGATHVKSTFRSPDTAFNEVGKPGITPAVVVKSVESIPKEVCEIAETLNLYCSPFFNPGTV